jgi:general stress protein 26
MVRKEGPMAEYSQMSTEEAIDRIWELAKSIDFCMFVTWDGERQRARPLSARPNRDEHRIFFLTDVHGAKDEQIERFPKVTMAFSDIRAHDYVVITGTARVSDDRARIRDLWTRADEAWWDSADDPNIRVIAVEPEDAELWKGPNRLVAGAKMLAAAVSGAKVDFGENRKVDRL